MVSSTVSPSRKPEPVTIISPGLSGNVVRWSAAVEAPLSSTTATTATTRIATMASSSGIASGRARNHARSRRARASAPPPPPPPSVFGGSGGATRSIGAASVIENRCASDPRMNRAGVAHSMSFWSARIASRASDTAVSTAWPSARTV